MRKTLSRTWVLFVCFGAATVITQLWHVSTIHTSNKFYGNSHLDHRSLDEAFVVKDNLNLKVNGQEKLSPACFPHLKVAKQAIYDIKKNNGNENNKSPKLPDLSYNESKPITRIYFYHVRKAGGTMIRKYLKKVASYYQINLMIQENKNAGLEEVGSHVTLDELEQNTLYVTNLRDPVERSISHFKYDGRWDCQQLVKNTSFIPTKFNANSFLTWNQTRGFVQSNCDVPFSFIGCAVNCYIQTFSGKGCTENNWQTEYALAIDRLSRYNLILVFEKFRDENYVQAIEDFFGVKGFGEDSIMFCGPEARDANKKVPLHVGFESVLRLTKLNEMDTRLYRETTKCLDKLAGKYAFPRMNARNFLTQDKKNISE